MSLFSSKSETIILDREVGQIDVSIGTSLALESAFNIHPEIKHNTPPIKNYDLLYVNLSTLFRNIYASLTSDNQNMVSVNDYVDVMLSEMNVIDGKVQDQTNSSVRVVFYFNDIYPTLKRRYRYAAVKIPTTDRQVIYQTTHDEVIKKTIPLIDDLNIKFFTHDIKDNGRCLILTHYSTDLLSRYGFDKLDLLESHTGKIKLPAQWGSKLSVRDDTMPFNHFTLQVFGDGSTLFSAQPIKYRRVVSEIAKKDKWSAITTMAKIKQSLNKIDDRHIRDHLQLLTLTN